MCVDKLTDEQVAALKDHFSHFDKDCDGMITIEEFEAAMKSMGLNPTESDLNKKFTEFDVDGNCKIDFAEFLAEIEAAFRGLDLDRNGFIDAEDMKQAMTNIGKKVTDEEIDKTIKEVDTNGDGHASFEEFVIIGADKLSDKQIATFKDIFSHFDKDGDGMITIEVFRAAMKSMGLNPTASDLKKKFTEFDVDGNGKIDFAEFLVAVEAAFRELDLDRNGFIDAADMKQAMSNIGKKVTDEEIAKTIKEVDTDGDGHVSFEEFVAYLASPSNWK